MGNSRAPLYALIVAALTNGVLDLGLTGVIWVTVLAYAVDAAILLAFVYRSLRRPIFRRYEERAREA